MQISGPVGNMIRSQMDTGPAKQRRRSTVAVRSMSLAFSPLSEEQVNALNAFIETELAGGALAFDMPHPVTEAVGRFRIIGGADALWSQQPVGRDAYRISLTMELLP